MYKTLITADVTFVSIDGITIDDDDDDDGR
jgi:hypothetical protein